MRIALIILIGIHGVIHLFGFLKAYEIIEFNAITQPVSKSYGVFWLLTFVLFVITIILILVHSSHWWLTGFLALIVSQILIFSYWSDAKFGTIANIIILLAVIVAYSSYSFTNKIRAERTRLFENSQLITQNVFSEDKILDLPPIVQKWLTYSGAIGIQVVSNVHLVQELKLKMKPTQTDWYEGKAEQYFTVQPPAFNWNINTKMNSILQIAGRDKFENGNGEMTIKLFSLIPVADAINNEKVNQATLQRYLAEIVWFPSASLSPYIKWEMINDHSAKATMEYNGTKGSGIFHFDKRSEERRVGKECRYRWSRYNL